MTDYRKSRGVFKGASLFLLAAMLGALQAHADASSRDNEITMVTLNWEPLFGEDLERGGFFTAIAVTAFERAGYDVEYQFVPWARALKDNVDGYRDVVMGAYYTEERTEEFYYSNPVYPEEIGLIALPDIDVRRYDSLRDLTDYTIGYGRGFAHSEEFDNADYLDKEAADDLHLNIRKLFAGRVDMVAGGIPRLAEVLAQEGYDINEDVVIIEPPLISSPMHTIVSHSHPRGEELMADFNRGLREIMVDGTYDEILVEMGFSVPEFPENAVWAEGYGPRDLHGD